MRFGDHSVLRPVHSRCGGDVGAEPEHTGGVTREGEPVGATIEREGLASAVDVAARRFSLTPENKVPIVVGWTDLTFFGGVVPASLTGRKVHVEGSVVSGVLMATQVKVDD